MYTTGRPAAEIVAAEGLARIDDEAAIEAVVRDVVAANPGPVAQYRGGKQQTFGFLVGQTIKAMKGKANPALVNQLMRRILDEQ
jgi:aspartyl-tRNA(Asn)/glutamyl-tRNA(Gln) amidotransferase subunit B